MTAKEARVMLQSKHFHDPYGKWSYNTSLTHTQAIQLMLDAVNSHADDYIIPSLIEKNVRRACRP